MIWTGDEAISHAGAPHSKDICEGWGATITTGTNALDVVNNDGVERRKMGKGDKSNVLLCRD